jgi:CheY-like chemotaxis protein
VVYLENRVSPNFLTTKKLAIFEIIASQAAIALENARLYSDLEAAVKIREDFLALNPSLEKTSPSPNHLDIKMKNISILIIDDEPDICLSLQMVLELEGFSVHSASNGQDALNFLHSGSDLPWLILLDLMMPVMDGLEFLKIIRHDPIVSRIPVIVVSACARSEVVGEVRSYRVDQILSKPISLDFLLGSVFEVLSGAQQAALHPA